MTELIEKLVAQAGITNDQAGKTLEVIKDFVKEKFPMLAGAVDNIFGAQAAAPAAAQPAAEAGGLLDKISDLIPGQMGEKIEGFAKQAADGAEGLFEKAKDKFEDLTKK